VGERTRSATIEGVGLTIVFVLTCRPLCVRVCMHTSLCGRESTPNLSPPISSWTTEITSRSISPMQSEKARYVLAAIPFNVHVPGALARPSAFRGRREVGVSFWKIVVMRGRCGTGVVVETGMICQWGRGTV